MSAGRCGKCGAALAEDQRYCVTCGSRVTPAAVEDDQASPAPQPGPPPPRSKPPARTLVLHAFGHSGLLRLPSNRWIGVLGPGALASGVLVGVTLGPTLSGATLAA